MKIVPPIKSQGIKTKLVDWIKASAAGTEFDRWVEPFFGTGVVAFNVQPKKALLCDSNPHLVNFYQALQRKEITGSVVREYLNVEGKLLLETEGEHYYVVRERFNATGHPLDFMFLSRACFNGMMRFNKSGGFNVPFCRKPNRFAPALITRICNQVDSVSRLLELGDYTFKCQDFSKTLKEVGAQDLVYCDPPYLGRYADYYNSWSQNNELELHKTLKNSGANFMVSTWFGNKFRKNENINIIWSPYYVSTRDHFYHIGGKEKNRNTIIEAIISNFSPPLEGTEHE